MNEQQILTTSLGVLLFPFVCFALGAVGFLFGIPITRYHFVSAFCLTVVVQYYYCTEKRFFLSSAMLSSAILGLCFLAASLDNEYTMDAMVYHKTAAAAMAEGWNPVWQENFAQWLAERGFQSDDCNESHAHFFPKGQWIVCAVAYKAAGNLNAGDFANYALIFVGFAIGGLCLTKWLKLDWRLAILAAGAMALNPFACDQASTGQVDGLLGSLLLLFCLSSVAWLKTGDNCLVPFVVMSALYGCNLKFTGPVYFGILAAGLSALFLLNIVYKKPEIKVSPQRWFGSMAAATVAFLILGVHPYITNTIYYSSPVYPLHTFSTSHPKVDLLEKWYRLDDFRNASTFQRFLFSHIYGQPDYEYNRSQPHEILVDQIRFFPVRQLALDINGFGRLFGIALILSTGLLFFVRRSEAWAVILGIILTILVQPHSWCGRFIPQLWILPPLTGIILYSQFSQEDMKEYWFSNRMRWLCRMLISVLFCYGLFIFTVSQAKFFAIACMDMEFSERLERTPGGCLMGTFPAWSAASENDIYAAGRSNWLNYYLTCLIKDSRWNVSVLPNQENTNRPPIVFYNLYAYYPPEKMAIKNEYETENITYSGIGASRACYLLQKRICQRIRQFRNVWGV